MTNRSVQACGMATPTSNTQASTTFRPGARQHRTSNSQGPTPTRHKPRRARKAERAKPSAQSGVPAEIARAAMRCWSRSTSMPMATIVARQTITRSRTCQRALLLSGRTSSTSDVIGRHISTGDLIGRHVIDRRRHRSPHHRPATSSVATSSTNSDLSDLIDRTSSLTICGWGLCAMMERESSGRAVPDARAREPDHRKASEAAPIDGAYRLCVGRTRRDRRRRCATRYDCRCTARVHTPHARPPVSPPAKPMTTLAGTGICFDSAAQIGSAITPNTTPRMAFLVTGPIMVPRKCTLRAMPGVQGFSVLDVQRCARKARQLDGSG
jgi:hypothetical protein